MRDIKFRAWDGKKFHFYTSLSGLYGVLDPIEQQYTGLKDKNGKEIYEGDIVKSLMWVIGTAVSEGSIVEVSYDIAGFYPFVLYGWETELKADKCEVIGNVYENPELLKETL